MKTALAAAAIFLSAFAVEAGDRIVIKVGYSPGGSYDSKARLIAEHLGKHIEGGPEIIVENMPGAGSMKLAKVFLKSGATDGSEIAMVSSALALRPIFKPDDTNFDPRGVSYVASTADASSYCITQKGSGIDSFEALLGSDAKLGATGKGSTTYTFPSAIKNAFGASFEVLTGFKGGAEILLAMERGEIQGRCGISASSIAAGGLTEKVNVIAEMALEPKGEIEGAAFVLGLAPEDKREALGLVFASSSIHHPLIAHKDTDPDTLRALRDAVAALATDEAFLSVASERRQSVSIKPGEMVEQTIGALLSSPRETQELAREIVK